LGKTTGRSKRRYRRLYMRLRRQERAFRDREVSQQSLYRANRKAERPIVKARIPKCYFCHKPGELKKVWRVIPQAGGRLVNLEVDYCGKC